MHDGDEDRSKGNGDVADVVIAFLEHLSDDVGDEDAEDAHGGVDSSVGSPVGIGEVLFDEVDG